MDVTQEILSEITTYMKYAKYSPEKKRRETWKELVTRNKEMHQAKFPQLKDEIEESYKLVYDKKVLPSMRSMQFTSNPKPHLQSFCLATCPPKTSSLPWSWSSSI